MLETKEIMARTRALCAQHNVIPLYVAETGSRASGWPDPNSDHDLRLIYMRPAHEYVSLFDRKVSLNVRDDQFELVGWDVRHCLHEAQRSALSVVEYLTSDIVHHDGYMGIELAAHVTVSFKNRLLPILEKHHSPAALGHAHRSMIRTTTRRSRQMSLKETLICLRAVLAIEHLFAFPGKLPPRRIHDLQIALIGTIESGLVNEISHLVQLKQSGSADRGWRLPDKWLSAGVIEHWHSSDDILKLPAVDLPREPFDELYRSILEHGVKLT
jgi:predicted nucleotidyltransferase